MVLKDILKQLPSSIFVEDSWKVKGRPLFLGLIKHYAENGFRIKYIKFDCSLSNEKDEMKDFPVQIEGFDWKESPLTTDPFKVFTSDSVQENTVIAIDSLSPLLLHCTVKEIIAAIREAVNKKASVIGLLHGDVHQIYDVMQLDYAFSCHLSVMKVNGKDACRGVLKKSGGKVLDMDEFYHVSPNWSLAGIEEIKEVTAPDISESAKAPLPKSTFKLDLNPNEEKARSQVVLPYIRKSADSTKQEEKKGQIFYETEQPDWEDEDPDDDLEI